MTREMITYYAHRAAEYESVYASPRWQEDLAWMRERVAALFAGRRVFEVACGTGYWTRHAAERARAVRATDVNTDTLTLARAKTYATAVTFEPRDAYAPATDPERFDGGLAALWLSHVDLGRMDEFLRAFHSHLEPGAAVLMFDERESPERKPPPSRTDEAGNRYEMRRLENGERFEIVKNFFDGAQLARLIEPHGGRLVYRELRAFWVVEYQLR
ncbi:MAG TPA: class I SAM-dependent methyltransferase [Candidatus Dormibacteraeota bacterium]|nr:class I SAM-dependent methyltransferase [Candidatus Dormibacteraeota bacterium]